MNAFETIITSDPTALSKRLKAAGDHKQEGTPRVVVVASKLRLRTKQLVCALGFHNRVLELHDILPLVGFENLEELHSTSEEYYRDDMYEDLKLSNILSIYTTNRGNEENRQRLLKHSRHRLHALEQIIGKTINANIINQYREEVRAIYLEGVADIEFVQSRLDAEENGFRAMVSEVLLVAKSKLVPLGNIFFSDMVMPEEKRQLLKEGIIPMALVMERLGEKQLTSQEKEILQDHVRHTPVP